MSKRQLLCLLGIWVILFLFLGVPSLWHKIISVISGLIIVFVAYNLPHEKREGKSDSAFVDNSHINNSEPSI